MTISNLLAYHTLRTMGVKPAMAWRLAHRPSIVRVFG